MPIVRIQLGPELRKHLPNFNRKPVEHQRNTLLIEQQLHRLLPRNTTLGVEVRRVLRARVHRVHLIQLVLGDVQLVDLLMKAELLELEVHALAGESYRWKAWVQLKK